MVLVEELIPAGTVTLIFICGLIAVNKQIAKRPTYKEIEEKYTEIKLCNEIHKSTNEKLDCIPKIKDIVARLETKVDILLNGK
jgi:hypothetical protein